MILVFSLLEKFFIIRYYTWFFSITKNQIWWISFLTHYYRQLSGDCKMKNYKTGTYWFYNFYFSISGKMFVIRYMIFKIDLEQILIQRILIGWEATLNNYLWSFHLIYCKLLILRYSFYSNSNRMSVCVVKKPAYRWSDMVLFFPMKISIGPIKVYIYFERLYF